MKRVMMMLCLLIANAVRADESLVTALQLDPAQAVQVSAIEAEHRKRFASVRQDFNRESRALRRARLAHDTDEIARLTAVTEALRQTMVDQQSAEDAAIRALLRAEQSSAFDAWIEQRRAMKGSSRDERSLGH